MISLALCIATEHDPWLVLLAVFICCVGAFSVVQMAERARQTAGMQRVGWVFLTAVAGGATIWCTHFVAMLAFKVDVPVTFDPVLTIGSLVVAVLGSFAGFLVGTSSRNAIVQGAGGIAFGSSISAMHFMGMRAYRVDGIMQWDNGFIAAALICASLFGAAGMIVLGREKLRWRIAIGTGLIVTAIATLHFLAMTALDIVPIRLSDTIVGTREVTALALATGLVGLIVIGAGVFAAMIDRENRSDTLKQLRHMALNDSLTGLPNRAGFGEALQTRIDAARTGGGKLGLCVIDLVRFKEVNDVHGHSAGDEVLSILADRLRSAIGPNDFVARLGGDEFVAVSSFTEPAVLAETAGRIHVAMREPLKVAGFEARLGASVGIAVYPDDAPDIDTLSNNADLAMYRAKCEGSHAPCFYDSTLDEQIRERRELANDLGEAIFADGLHIHYQVQADVRTGEVTGYEALVRWNHPVHGAVPPSVFVPIAEQHGLILGLGEWVLRRACADAAAWPHESKVAVNVSALQLAHNDLPALFHRVMLETGLPPRRLEIELTETAIMANRERAVHVLRQIKALGIGVALDDFGTGYSSLETLRTFAFDKIKLDRFFVSELEDSPQATAIIRAVLALGKSLSIPVLAEGIETEAQLGVLIREGCDEAQGFLLGRPQAEAKPPAERRQGKGDLRDAA